MSLWKQPRLQALSAAGRLRAWMGGSAPRSLSRLDAEERLTLRAFFREQLQEFRDHWGEESDRDTLRLFWCRARHDAHATHREPGSMPT